MRIIKAEQITSMIASLCEEAAVDLPKDIMQQLLNAYEQEPFQIAKETLQTMIDNAKIAKEEKIPICQDTGMAVVFIDIGQEVHIEGNLNDAISQGVALGYAQGFLRKSIVDDPLFDRINTKNNTPAVIHYNIVPGENIKICVAPKGFGSENMSQIKMLKPSDGVEGVKQFVLDVVESAGPNACPPMVIGVGIGGNLETVALQAKKAMLKNLDDYNQNERYADLEKELLTLVNQTGIGPAGYGGKTTALSLKINQAPTHIAGMPCAVAICCHVSRHKEGVI